MRIISGSSDIEDNLRSGSSSSEDGCDDVKSVKSSDIELNNFNQSTCERWPHHPYYTDSDDIGNRICDGPKSHPKMLTTCDVTADRQPMSVKDLAANLQQFYTNSMAIGEDQKVMNIPKGKPPVKPKKFVTKVDISIARKHPSALKGLSKEDAEAVEVLDKSIAMSERQNLHKFRPQPKKAQLESNNLIEEIVIPPTVQAPASQSSKETISTEEHILAQRTHQLAKHEICGILDDLQSPKSCEVGKFADIDLPPRAASSSSTDSGVPGCRDPLLVAAIDLGTAYSGYAFSFAKDPQNIRVMKKSDAFWIHKNKQPTCVLLKPTGQFHSFGFNAQIDYHDLEVSDDKHRWMYFDKFKMALHNTENLSLDTEIRAVNGHSVKALTIFSHVLAYFKSLVLGELSDSAGTTINNEDVRWVITVPAIWRQPAKQFMRAAAYHAGLACEDNPSQILIALEPEAASLYCRQLKVEQVDNEAGSEGSSMTKLPHLTAGTRYMVVDCGGGTVDITVYEVDSCTDNLRELHKATGGPYGSVGVDLQFQLLLNNIFGEEFIEKYKKEVPQGFVYLMLIFEGRKVCATVTMNTPLNIELPYSFIQAYQKYANDTSSIACIQKCVENSGVEGVCFSSTGMLRVKPEVMLDLFRPTVASIVQHIREVLLQPRIAFSAPGSPSSSISYIFLVGGFAESQILQSHIKSEFCNSNTTVIIPRDVSISILHGAVLFGLNPSVVSVRCSRMTYGVGILNHFDPELHPRDKKFIGKDGVEWCTDVFDKFVVSNQSIELGDTVCRSYTPASSSQRYLVLHVYMSEDEHPKFITDRGVTRCGTLALDLQAGMSDPEQQQNYGVVTSGKGREVQVIMTFGDTEIKANAVDMATNKRVGAHVKFLT